MEFFILQNTQSGKLSLTTKEIQKWSLTKTHKVITFFISSNDRTLIDQSSDGISYFLRQRSNIFVLSSNANVNLEHIKTRIELYAHDRLGRHEMPIITALANKHQNSRVLELVHFIQQLSIHTPIKYGFVFDEADSTYPLLREQNVLVDKKLLHYHSIFVQDKSCLHRVGFVTATEGCLLDSDYPECANAVLHQCAQNEFSDQYRAIHTVDAVCHPYDSNASHNEYALHVLQKNRKHFFGKVEGAYRKIIIHSNSLTSDMEQLAEQCVAMGMNALVFNMDGLSIYSTGKSIPYIPLRGKRFNQILFQTVETYSLDTKPLAIIGRRKVDRGLSFHYAPRDGSKGLIWTDMIMGEVGDLSVIVQKFGRMAGIISHCPQYTGKCHYWSTSDALQRCIEKNRVNDRANDFASDLTLAQALDAATIAVEERFVEKLSVNDPSLPERLEYYVRSDTRESVNSYRVLSDCVEFYNGLCLDKRAGIPFLISLEQEEMRVVMETSVLQRKSMVKSLILEKFPHLEEDIDEFQFGDCREIHSAEFLIDSSISGRKIGYPLEDGTENVFHVLIHQESSTFIMLIWNGSSLKTQKRCQTVKVKGKYAGEKCGKKCRDGQDVCQEHSIKEFIVEIEEDSDDEEEFIFEMKE